MHVKLVEGDVLINLNRISMRLDVVRIIWPKFCRGVIFFAPQGNSKKKYSECYENYADAWKQVRALFSCIILVYTHNVLNFCEMSEWHHLKYWCRHIHRFFMKFYWYCVKYVHIIASWWNRHRYQKCKISACKVFLKIHFTFTKNLLCIGHIGPKFNQNCDKHLKITLVDSIRQIYFPFCK